MIYCEIVRVGRIVNFRGKKIGCLCIGSGILLGIFFLVFKFKDYVISRRCGLSLIYIIVEFIY